MFERGTMIRIVRWLGTGLKYAAGVLGWGIVFAFLQMQCIFSEGSFVDGLWMKGLHHGLVKNLVGQVAYRARGGYGDFGCGDKYIYWALYHPGRAEAEGEIRSLSSLVDTATWRDAGVDGIFSYYVDSRHKYRMRWISDGVDISAADR